jgi:hypothetical protein
MIRFYLGGEQLLETDPKKIFGIVLSSIDDIKWWSTEAIYDFVRGTHCELKIYAKARREEIEKDKFSKEEKTKLTKFINNDINIPKNREKLINFYYKQILNSEKKGLLPGFGMEGSLANPEYNSIYQKTNSKLGVVTD